MMMGIKNEKPSQILGSNKAVIIKHPTVLKHSENEAELQGIMIC